MTAPVAREHPRGLVILGHPVAHSRSPVFQSAALEAAQLSVRYTRIDTPPDRLDDTLRQCAEERWGGNITVPLKELVAERCTRLSNVAMRAGAVNTFWFDGNQLVGHNTDVDGANATIDALCPNGLNGPVVLLGAGGSAAAVLVALTERKSAELTVIARTPERAEALLTRVGATGVVRSSDDALVNDLLGSASLVINATPIGMRDDALPVAIERLGSDTAVYDLVYRDLGTAWTRAAKARGLRAEDGLRMLVEQGAAAFHCWFGIEPSRDVMWKSLGLNGPPQHGAIRSST